MPESRFLYSGHPDAAENQRRRVNADQQKGNGLGTVKLSQPNVIDYKCRAEVIAHAHSLVAVLPLKCPRAYISPVSLAPMGNRRSVPGTEDRALPACAGPARAELQYLLKNGMIQVALDYKYKKSCRKGAAWERRFCTTKAVLLPYPAPSALEKPADTVTIKSV